MRALIIAALATATLASSVEVAPAQGPDVVPITRNYRGEPACPGNYVIRGGACVSIYAGRRSAAPRRAPDAAPIMRNYRGEQTCPSGYVIRGNACVSVGALRARGLSAAERPGFRRGYQREYYRDDYYEGPRRRSYRPGPDVPYAGGGRAAAQPWVNRRGELQCPSNYVIRGGICVSLY